MSPLADRKMTGTVTPRARSSRQAVKPSIFGIITSMMTRSGATLPTSASASAPFSA